MRRQQQNQPLKGITLQEYMFSYSLKRKLNSKSRSRQHKDKPDINSSMINASITKLTREQLLNEVKLQIRKYVVRDEEFVFLNQLIDRLTQLYKMEIQEARRDRNILQSIIKENSFVNMDKTQYKSIIDQKIFLSPQKQQKDFLSKTLMQQSTFQPRKSTIVQNQLKSVKQPGRKSSAQIKCHNRNTSIQSDQSIPQINILLATKNGAEEQETKQTLNHFRQINEDLSQSKRSISFAQENQEQLGVLPQMSKIQIKFSKTETEFSAFKDNSRKKQQLAKSSIKSQKQDHLNQYIQIQTPSALKHRTNQRLYSNPNVTGALNKFQNFRNRRGSGQNLKIN